MVCKVTDYLSNSATFALIIRIVYEEILAIQSHRTRRTNPFRPFLTVVSVQSVFVLLFDRLLRDIQQNLIQNQTTSPVVQTLCFVYRCFKRFTGDDGIFFKKRHSFEESWVLTFRPIMLLHNPYLPFIHQAQGLPLCVQGSICISS